MKTVTIQIPDDCEVQIVRSKNKFKKGDVIVSRCGLIAIYEKTEIREYDREVVYYSTLYSPSYGKLRKINKVDFGIGYEKDCSLANKEQKNQLIAALELEAKTNEDAKIVLKEVFNIEVKPVIRTYKDLMRNRIRISGYDICLDSTMPNVEVMSGLMNRRVAASEKVAKSMLAMAQISQLMPYYGGAISDEEWANNKIKYVIVKVSNEIHADSFFCRYHFLAFHTREQRDDFLKYNERLVKDYLMID